MTEKWINKQYQEEGLPIFIYAGNNGSKLLARVYKTGHTNKGAISLAKRIASVPDLERQNQIMREALEWYADQSVEPGDNTGQIAEEALKKVNDA